MNYSGHLIIGLPGTELSHQDKSWIKHPAVAGIILFKHNFESKKQIKTLCESIRKVRSSIFICVDHEGGRVQRFKEEFTEIPPMGTLGQLYSVDQGAALAQAKAYGDIIASELRDVGVDFSFAPVLDLDYRKSAIIGDRAFDSDPEIVAALAGSFIEGLHAQGSIACGKHFPGHGYVTPDSHVADPVDDRPLEALLSNDMLPYILLSDNLDALMTAHILFPEIDNEIVSYSSHWLKTILRDQLGYKGLIISDDLVMHAAAKDAPMDRVQRALHAGCDLVLYCQDYEGIQLILDSSPR
jgi:beta-N-acetylhexosaminidase